MKRPNGVNSARVIEVIETKAIRGSGIERDPAREIIQYWDLDGNLLAVADCDPQYLAELSVWESNRLAEIIENWKEKQKREEKEVV